MAVKTLPEHRKTARVDFHTHVEIDLPASSRTAAPSPAPANSTHFEGDSLNLSEGGMCLRLHQPLEIRAHVRLRLFPEREKKPVEFAGRVAWIVQRLDLRDSPPFLYDIGVEFVNPSASLRQFASRSGVTVKAVEPKPKHPMLPAATIRERHYVPRLDREAVTGAWHLIVWVEGVPCFSRRFPSHKEAVGAWEQFKRHTARAGRRPKSKPGR